MFTGLSMPANRMQKNAMIGIAEPCKIYDVFESNFDKKLIKACESRTEAALHLGIKTSHISAIIKNKCRHKNKKLGKVITIR
jgi:hypothetical protein